MNPNNQFNPFNIPGFQSQDPYNPFNPNFSNNLFNTVNQSIGQAFSGFYQSPFGTSTSNSQSQNSFPQANINITNSWNMGNNYYQGQQQHEPEPEMNMEQNHDSFAGTKKRKEEPKKKNSEAKSEKNPDLESAENNPNSGHYYKKLGNEFYTKGMLQEALKYYSKAIELNDTESVFFSNRARCLRKLNQLKKAYEDSKYAVELDDKNIKAHLLCGQILAELGKLEPGYEKINLALNRMTKALTLCAGQNKLDFENDLNRNILRVKKLKWYKHQQTEKQHKLEILNDLKKSLEKNKELTIEEKEQKYQIYLQTIGDPKTSLNFEIPDYLCCKITMELMEDPVITPAGITYEHKVVTEHFEKNGHTDPVTREPINIESVFPNLSVKQATAAFLRDNPWAYEYTMGETIDDIKF
jgi:STIP1 family protein 1